MAITFGWAELTTRYPEFKAIPPEMVEACITEARAMWDETRCGSVFPTLLAAQTAEFLTRSPFGLPARPTDSAPSKYWRTVQECVRRLPYRGMVSSG